MLQIKIIPPLMGGTKGGCVGAGFKPAPTLPTQLPYQGGGTRFSLRPLRLCGGLNCYCNSPRHASISFILKGFVITFFAPFLTASFAISWSVYAVIITI